MSVDLAIKGLRSFYTMHVHLKAKVSINNCFVFGSDISLFTVDVNICQKSVKFAPGFSPLGSFRGGENKQKEKEESKHIQVYSLKI